jgi:hypothetical protein
VPTAVFRVLHEILAINAQPGDFLVVRSGHPRSFVLHRDLDLRALSIIRDPSAVVLLNSPAPVVCQEASPSPRESPARGGMRLLA